MGFLSVVPQNVRHCNALSVFIKYEKVQTKISNSQHLAAVYTQNKSCRATVADLALSQCLLHHHGSSELK